MLKGILKRLSYFLSKLKPKIYKKSLYIGQKEIIKFTSAGIKKFLFKIVWIVIVTVMLISMILGGLALTQPTQ